MLARSGAYHETSREYSVISQESHEPGEADSADVPGRIDLGASATWLFEGVEGLARLTGPFVYTASPGDSFRARLTRVRLDHVALEAFGASPHQVNRGTTEISRDPLATLGFIFLAEGALDVALGENQFQLRSGEFIVVDSRDPISYTTLGRIRSMTASVQIDDIPLYLRERGMTIPGPLRRTALTDSFLSFVSTILRSTAAGRPAHGSELSRATADLLCAVLAEAQSIAQQLTGPAGLRYRIEEYIEANLSDPHLGPQSIADALGISVRHAHNVFDVGVRTIGRYIRDRRITRVASELRSRPETVELSALAVRYGFSSVGVMSHAFHLQIGVSPTEYRARGHRSFD